MSNIYSRNAAVGHPHVQQLIEAMGEHADKLRFAACFSPSAHDFDIVLVGRSDSDVGTSFLPLLRAVHRACPTVVGFGSFRQQVFLIEANGAAAPPLHVLAYPSRSVAEQVEPTLLLKKIGSFTRPVIDDPLREAWATRPLEPLTERLARHRMLLAETLVLLELGQMHGDRLIPEVRHKLAYVARHAAEEVLVSHHGIDLKELRTRDDVVSRIDEHGLPRLILEAMEPGDRGNALLASLFQQLDSWIQSHE